MAKRERLDVANVNQHVVTSAAPRPRKKRAPKAPQVEATEVAVDEEKVDPAGADLPSES